MLLFLEFNVYTEIEYTLQRIGKTIPGHFRITHLELRENK